VLFNGKTNEKCTFSSTHRNLKEGNASKSLYTEIHKNMGFIDTNNMMKNSYSTSHRSMKWFKTGLSLSPNTFIIHSLCNSTLIQEAF
jgi:hypothetical protein